MNYDEKSVKIFLKGYPGQFVSARVISRRLGGRQRYHQDPLWVVPILTALVEKNVVEMDPQGHYRLKKVEPTDRRNRTWLSPQVKKILSRSNQDFSRVIKIEDEDDDV